MLYSTSDAARVLGVDETSVRKWLRSGVVRASEGKGRARRFSFSDLVALRAAKELFERGVSLAAVRRNIAALEGALPAGSDAGGEAGVRAGSSLARLRVVSDGQRLVVLGDDVIFEPLSGQVVMDFVVGALSTRVAEVLALPTQSAPPSDERTAYGWFHEGCRLEAVAGDAAAQAAYGRAIALDPAIAAAHTNLGNIAHRGGHRGEARQHYERALSIDPDQPEARFNLGNLLDELGETDAAIAAWTRVCALSPDFADAHFNLGEALARRGQTASAAAALERYLLLDGRGSWAESARSLMAALLPTAAPRA